MVTFGRMEASVDHFDGLRAGTNQMNAVSFGGYWTRFFPQGAYLDGVLAATWFDRQAHGRFLAPLKTETTAVAVSLEGGYSFPIDQGDWRIEPQGQLVYQHLDSDEVRDAAPFPQRSLADSGRSRAGANGPS